MSKPAPNAYSTFARSFSDLQHKQQEHQQRQQQRLAALQASVPREDDEVDAATTAASVTATARSRLRALASAVAVRAATACLPCIDVFSELNVLPGLRTCFGLRKPKPEEESLIASPKGSARAVENGTSEAKTAVEGRRLCHRALPRLSQLVRKSCPKRRVPARPIILP
jgi:hypothetical protein